MNATFNIKVKIDTNNVTTVFGSEQIEDMDTTLLASILKVFSNLQDSLKKQVTKFYDVKDQQNTSEIKDGEQTSSTTVQESEAAEQQ